MAGSGAHAELFFIARTRLSFHTEGKRERELEHSRCLLHLTRALQLDGRQKLAQDTAPMPTRASRISQQANQVQDYPSNI
jgi:hypothetical protein